MRVNQTDPIPAVASEQRTAGHRVEARPVQSAVGPAAHLEIARPDGTNVVVQIQNDNRVVYRFIDTSTGKLIEQIPSQEMVNFANAIAKALPSLIKSELQK